jgi:hypothetical protein
MLLLLQSLVLLLEERDAEELVLCRALYVTVVAEPGAVAGGAGR